MRGSVSARGSIATHTNNRKWRSIVRFEGCRRVRRHGSRCPPSGRTSSRDMEGHESATTGPGLRGRSCTEARPKGTDSRVVRVIAWHGRFAKARSNAILSVCRPRSAYRKRDAVLEDGTHGRAREPCSPAHRADIIAMRRHHAGMSGSACREAAVQRRPSMGVNACIGGTKEAAERLPCHPCRHRRSYPYRPASRQRPSASSRRGRYAIHAGQSISRDRHGPCRTLAF